MSVLEGTGIKSLALRMAFMGSEEVGPHGKLTGRGQHELGGRVACACLRPCEMLLEKAALRSSLSLVFLEHQVSLPIHVLGHCNRPSPSKAKAVGSSGLRLESTNR